MGNALYLKTVIVRDGERTGRAVFVEEEASDPFDIGIILGSVGQGIECGIGVIEGERPDTVDGVP